MRSIRRMRGFSLIELMVAVAIGLIVILIIGQQVALFENQKRTTTGGSDAQTNGMAALFTLERAVKTSGFGLTGPTGSTCTAINIAYGGTVRSNGWPIAPVRIVDGGAGSDTIVTTGSDTTLAIAPITMTNVNLSAAPPQITIDADNGKALNDIEYGPNKTATKPTVLMLAPRNAGDPCTLVEVSAISADFKTLSFALGTGYTPTTLGTPYFTTFPTYNINDHVLVDMNRFDRKRYEIQCSQLVSSNPDAVTAPNCTNTDPVASNIVYMKAQYGIAPVGSQTVNQWLDATGATWGATNTTPSAADIQRIKAIRVAIVARDSQYNRDAVTAGPLTLWTDAVGNPLKTMTLAGDQTHYRYKVFTTIVPIRNMIWATKP